MSTLLDSKFNKIYSQLENLVKYIATRNEGMGKEDVEQELRLELVKCFPKYQHLPEDQIIKVMKSIFFYRIKELRYKVFLTLRQKMLADSYSIDDVEENETALVPYKAMVDDTPSVEHIVEVKELMTQVRENLSPMAQQVFDAVMYDVDGRLHTVLILAMHRASSKYRQPCVNVKPAHIASALNIPVSSVHKAYKEIAEVMNG
jgi:hypothetical protein